MNSHLIELAERTNDGVHVRLLWQKVGGDVMLEVTDEKTGMSYEVHVPSAHAMDAFRHPFAYVSSADARVVASNGSGASGTAAGIHRAA